MKCVNWMGRRSLWRSPHRHNALVSRLSRRLYPRPESHSPFRLSIIRGYDNRALIRLALYEHSGELSCPASAVKSVQEVLAQLNKTWLALKLPRYRGLTGRKLTLTMIS
jgi:hypothetical protein